MATRSSVLKADNFAKAKEIAAWKEEVAAHWDSFQVESFTADAQYMTDGPVVGTQSTFNLVIDRRELQGDLGVEIVVTKEDPEKHRPIIVLKKEFELKKEEGSKLFYELKVTPTEAGSQKVGFRVFPKNADLPHRMDFAYIRWIQL